jgi:hypothetical protein
MTLRRANRGVQRTATRASLRASAADAESFGNVSDRL